MDKPEIKPCRVCGGKPTMTSYTAWNHKASRMSVSWSVVCPGCGQLGVGATNHQDDSDEEIKSRAVERWNYSQENDR